MIKINLHSETVDVIVGGRTLTLSRIEAEKLEGQLRAANKMILNHRINTTKALAKAWKR